MHKCILLKNLLWIGSKTRLLSKVLNSSMIACWRSATVWGRLDSIFGFSKPHNALSQELRSGERGGQLVGPNLPTHRSQKWRFKKCRVMRAVWAGAPSCWKWAELSIPLLTSSGNNSFQSMLMYAVAVTRPTRKNGPIKCFDDIAAKTITCGGCCLTWSKKNGFC